MSIESKRANLAHYPHEEKTAHESGNFLEIRRLELPWQLLAVLREPASAPFFSGLKPRKTSNFGDRLRKFSNDPERKTKEMKESSHKEVWKQVFWGWWI